MPKKEVEVEKEEEQQKHEEPVVASQAQNDIEEELEEFLDVEE